MGGEEEPPLQPADGTASGRRRQRARRSAAADGARVHQSRHAAQAVLGHLPEEAAHLPAPRGLSLQLWRRA
eukprot:4477606-Prymnesium_polylepis.1